MNLHLTGKTALVTAASGGIGSGVAEALAPTSCPEQALFRHIALGLMPSGP
jgi:NAD(P)-dependent dehydrogenase (short-subunit alcohol dehydrogenase family)